MLNRSYVFEIGENLNIYTIFYKQTINVRINKIVRLKINDRKIKSIMLQW